MSWVPALEGWLVTRYDLAVAVMRDPATFTVHDERFSTARLVGASMLSLDGAEHERHRAPFAAPFRPGVVREHFTAAAQAECDGLLATLRRKGQATCGRSLPGRWPRECSPARSGSTARRPGRCAAPTRRSWRRSTR